MGSHIEGMRDYVGCCLATYLLSAHPSCGRLVIVSLPGQYEIAAHERANKTPTMNYYPYTQPRTHPLVDRRDRACTTMPNTHLLAILAHCIRAHSRVYSERH